MTQTFDKTKNAYLVLAHEDLAMLNLLLLRLVKTGVVFVHIDSGCRISEQDVISLPGIHVYKEIKVFWGGWSIVEATRFLADKAIENGADRLTLLSGISYPIVKDEELIGLAQSNVDIFEAGVVELDSISKSFRRRFTSGHLDFKVGNSFAARILRRLSREFFAVLPSLNPDLALHPLKLMVGSQWWSVTTKTYLDAMDLLKEHILIERYFQKIECSDESFFGTIFTQVSINHNNVGTTYVKWGKRGRPEFLVEIYPEQRGTFLFARKLNSETMERSLWLSREL
jgi:Core-2/I-Branching enzyme